VNECRVEFRWYKPKTLVKSGHPLLRAIGGKVGKVKHNIKVNLFGGVSRKVLTPLVIFQKIMCRGDFQKLLRLSVIPHIREKFPYRHRLFMDNDPKHTSKSHSCYLIILIIFLLHQNHQI